MSTAYSGTPLIKKLGIKDRSKIKLINEPSNYYNLLGDLHKDTKICIEDESDLDFIHIFVHTTHELEKELLKAKEILKKNGMIWVSWMKGKNKSEVSENMIRDLALSIGLVDVKVCAIDEIWSGLKLVYRLKDR